MFWQTSQLRKASLQFLDQNGKPHVLSMSVKDKKRLFYLMRKLFAEDSFAYVLLGSKPVSWACYQKPFPFTDWETFCTSLKKYNRNMHLGWKTWVKYSHLFSTPHFWVETSKNHPAWVSILLANKEHFNTVVSDNKKDFQDVLHRKIVDGDQLLQEAKNRPLMSDLLESHQALMGIVLGYGRDNSWLFLERSEKQNPLGCVWDREDEWPPGTILICEGARDIKECLEIEACPSFAGKPNSEESLKLKENYLLTKEKVIHYYKGKDFLEATLSLLAGFLPFDESVMETF